MGILTLNRDEEWIDCEHKNWEEVIKDGWVFIAQTKEGVLMRRDGYLNEFKATTIEEKNKKIINSSQREIYLKRSDLRILERDGRVKYIQRDLDLIINLIPVWEDDSVEVA